MHFFLFVSKILYFIKLEILDLKGTVNSRFSSFCDHSKFFLLL